MLPGGVGGPPARESVVGGDDAVLSEGGVDAKGGVDSPEEVLKGVGGFPAGGAPVGGGCDDRLSAGGAPAAAGGFAAAASAGVGGVVPATPRMPLSQGYLAGPLGRPTCCFV